MALHIDKSMRLPDDEYFPSHEPKSGICVHHTVGGSAKSTFNWWMRDRSKSQNRIKVGTAYIIGRDGTVFEVFPPDAWAYQFGLKWPTVKKLKFEKRFVGIEIASEGALIKENGKLYCFDTVSPRTEKAPAEAFDYGTEWRGYRYFDRYEPAQVDALVQLIEKLCSDFDIKRRVPAGVFDFYGDQLARFQGIIGHSMVRTDKSDPVPDKTLWDRLVSDVGLKRVTIGEPPAREGGNMNDHDIEALFTHNAATLNQMNVSAGAVVSALLAELERHGRNTYIRLRDPVPGGHVVEYDFVKGDRQIISRIGKLLGFKEVTESRLEVSGG